MDFFYGQKGFFSIQNLIKHYFQSYFQGKQIKKKIAFFDQKHGLEKCDFWDFERLKFLWPRKVCFLSRTLFNIICNLILTENKKRKNTFFDQNHGLTPLEKCDFWDFERLKFLWPKKVSFLSRTLLNIISSVILRENQNRRKLHFLTQSGKKVKTGSNSKQENYRRASFFRQC